MLNYITTGREIKGIFRVFVVVVSKGAVALTLTSH